MEEGSGTGVGVTIGLGLGVDEGSSVGIWAHALEPNIRVAAVTAASGTSAALDFINVPPC
jgi:hypothetical protein